MRIAKRTLSMLIALVFVAFAVPMTAQGDDYAPVYASYGQYINQYVWGADMPTGTTMLLVSGTMPTGISLEGNNSTGFYFRGTPTMCGSYKVTFELRPQDAMWSYARYEFIISGDLVITTSSLPEGTVGEKYSKRIKANFPDAEFGFYYNPSGPNDYEKLNLTLSSDGKLSGTPNKAGSYSFFINCCSDLAGMETQKKFTLVIKSASTPTAEPTVEPTIGPDGDLEYLLWDYAADFNITARIGQPVEIEIFSYTNDDVSMFVPDVTLPAGMTLLADIGSCRLVGTAMEEGSYRFQLNLIINGTPYTLKFLLTIVDPSFDGFPSGVPLVPFTTAP